MAKSNTYDAARYRCWRDSRLSGSVRACTSEASRKGLNHLIYEIVDNAVDEHLAGYCTEIEVTLEKDGSATVQDNGRGIPVGMHAKGCRPSASSLRHCMRAANLTTARIRRAADCMASVRLS